MNAFFLVFSLSILILASGDRTSLTGGVLSSCGTPDLGFRLCSGEHKHDGLASQGNAR